MHTRRIAVSVAALIALAAPVPVAANETAPEFESTFVECGARTLVAGWTPPECPAASRSAVSTATSEAVADSDGRWSTRLVAETRLPAGGDSSAVSFLRFSTSVTTVDGGHLRVHLDELAASSVATCPTCVDRLHGPSSGRMLFVNLDYTDERGEVVSRAAWCILAAGRSTPSTRVVPDHDCSSGELLVPAATVVSVTLSIHAYAYTSDVGASASGTDSAGHVAAISVT